MSQPTDEQSVMLAFVAVVMTNAWFGGYFPFVGSRRWDARIHAQTLRLLREAGIVVRDARWRS